MALVLGGGYEQKFNAEDEESDDSNQSDDRDYDEIDCQNFHGGMNPYAVKTSGFKCPEEHPMTGYQRYRGKCTKCDVALHNLSCRRCDECDYNVCFECYKCSAENCTAKHGLQTSAMHKEHLELINILILYVYLYKNF